MVDFHFSKRREGSRDVLILCDFGTRHIGTVRDHLEAFKRYSQNTICVADVRSSHIMKTNFSIFDVVVLHYSIVISSESHVSSSMARKIREFRGYKVLFIQDEYRWVDRTAAAIANLGVDLIYSVINEELVDRVYHHTTIRHVRRNVTLTGFVPEQLTIRPVPGFSERKMDVGYRARKVPYWLGSFAQEKWYIGERFRKDAERYSLTCDIEYAENKRLYGEKWISFISNCRAILGTESGASFIDFTGEVQRAVEAYENANPNSCFKDVHERFLKDQDGDIVIRVISPRCFEAAALRTLMILYPGKYSGVLQPWRHYVPLERDHSNMDEIVEVLRDPQSAQQIIDNAYREVALNPRYSFCSMVEEFDRDLTENAQNLTSIVGQHQNAQVLALRARSQTTLKQLERQVEREFARKYRILMKLHVAAYVSVHWAIATFVPKRSQASVIATFKSIGRRFGLVKSS